jgi:hypothetical protein
VLFARAVVVPVWMTLFALIALLAPPLGATTSLPQLLGLALAVSALLAFMVSAGLGPVPHTYTPQGTAVAVLPSIDVDSWTAVVMRRVLGIVVSAGARFWYVRRVPAAIQRRTRAASDVRTMMPFDLGNRSPGLASRGLGPREGLRGRARGRPPDVVSL